MTQFVGLILAAGEGKRFGQPKATYIYQGERLVDRAVRLLRESGAEEIYVVLGAWLGEVPGAKIIENPKWQTGMGSSLQIGLNYLANNTELNRILITLVDLPGLTAPAITRVATDENEISVASYAGVRGHPVAFERQHWIPVAQSAHGDSGARDYLKTHSEKIKLIEVSDIASGEDLDFAPD
jgi:CTP:molybdopterin cytidylyltransferase MocA